MADRATQRVELLAEREVLEDQFVMSAASQGQRSRHQQDCVEHASSCPAGHGRINRHTGPSEVLARDTPRQFRHSRDSSTQRHRSAKSRAPPCLALEYGELMPESDDLRLDSASDVDHGVGGGVVAGRYKAAFSD